MYLDFYNYSILFILLMTINNCNTFFILLSNTDLQNLQMNHIQIYC